MNTSEAGHLLMKHKEQEIAGKATVIQGRDEGRKLSSYHELNFAKRGIDSRAKARQQK